MTGKPMQSTIASSRVFALLRLYFQILAILVTIQFRHVASARRHPSSASYRDSKRNIPYSQLLAQPPLPTYPKGTGFGSGSIDLGGLRVYEAQNFNKIWTIYEGGYNNSGTSFYEPTMLPQGYHLLGHSSQPNSKPIYSSILVAKDTTRNPNNSVLAQPISYTLHWTSVGVTINKDGEGYIWLPVPPAGYLPVGLVVTKSPDMPPLNMVRVVRADFTASIELDQWIWGWNGFDVTTMKPSDRGAGSLSVPVGTFMAAQDGQALPGLVCLKRAQLDESYMPNVDQVRAMVEAYAPVVYFHADEEYLPSTVDWFFQNGALLYRNGNSTGEPILPNGENLPGKGSIDDYFLDLPSGGAAQDRLKRGDVQDAKAYVHVKTAFGGTYTDLAIWLFYPFNGPIKFQLGPITIRLKQIGEHVADWEHLTLRVDNFNGGLKCMYLSQHNKGTWINAMELEYEGDGSNKPVVYASLHGHAFYPKGGHVIHTREMAMPLESNNNGTFDEDKWRFGPRNDTGKGGSVMDIRTQYEILRFANSNGSLAQPWLFYPGRWGPKKAYSLQNELHNDLDGAVDSLPAEKREEFREKLKSLFKIPPEIFGEEGPQGPMMKDSWVGDERT